MKRICLDRTGSYEIHVETVGDREILYKGKPFTAEGCTDIDLLNRIDKAVDSFEDGNLPIDGGYEILYRNDLIIRRKVRYDD